jgi:DNA topoisomerase I
MDGLTAKVFRTYNASITFQEELKKTNADDTIPDKILAYNRANREVAILCNHQRAVSKNHGDQIGKLSDRILVMKYELDRIRTEILDQKPKHSVKDEEISDIDDDARDRCKEMIHETNLKKLEKSNDKRREKGEEEVKDLPEPVDYSKYSIEQLEKKLAALQTRIATHKTQLIDKVMTTYPGRKQDYIFGYLQDKLH